MPNLSVHLAANEVKSVSFPIKVLRVGNHALRVTAKGTRLADAVEREVRVCANRRTGGTHEKQFLRKLGRHLHNSGGDRP